MKLGWPENNAQGSALRTNGLPNVSWVKDQIPHSPAIYLAISLETPSGFTIKAADHPKIRPANSERLLDPLFLLPAHYTWT